MPTPAMLAWARELQVGSWYMLDYRNRNEAVQLPGRACAGSCTLFVSPQGRGVLFQQHRLAAFLQAGLLVPAAGRSAHRARHAQRAGQARRRSRAAAELSGGAASDEAAEAALSAVARGAQWIRRSSSATNSSSRISASGSSPRLQNTISTMIFRSSRSSGPRRDGAGAVDHHLAHRRRQHAGRFEEADEADRLLAEVLLLGRASRRACCAALLARRPSASAARRPAPSSQVSASCDLVGFEAHGRRACASAARARGRHRGASSFRTDTRARRT